MIILNNLFSSYSVGNGCKYESNNDNFFLIAGPCVIESKEETLHIAKTLDDITNKLNIPFVFKGSFKNSFLEKPTRVWVHTCSLDHKNALNNYMSRGMKVFKKETIIA